MDVASPPLCQISYFGFASPRVSLLSDGIRFDSTATLAGWGGVVGLCGDAPLWADGLPGPPGSIRICTVLVELFPLDRAGSLNGPA